MSSNGPASGEGPLSRGTLQAIERASGKLAAATLASMEARMSWFAKMPADRRASVLLIVQTGVAGFVEWFHDPKTAFRLSVDAFRTAPRDLYRSMNLRHTVELVRVALEVLEQELPELAANERERALLTEAILRYGREIAFAAATTYAGAAEARGAWDARLEALVVDGVIRGDAEESLLSRAAALGWGPSDEATVLVGKPSADDPPTVVYGVRSRAARLGRPVLLSVQGTRLVVVLGGHTDQADAASCWPSWPRCSGRGRWWPGRPWRTWARRTAARRTRCPGCGRWSAGRGAATGAVRGPVAGAGAGR